MMAALDAIQRLFDAKSTPVAVARNVGLDLVQWLTPVKVSCAVARVESLLFEPRPACRVSFTFFTPEFEEPRSQ